MLEQGVEALMLRVQLVQLTGSFYNERKVVELVICFVGQNVSVHLHLRKFEGIAADQWSRIRLLGSLLTF